MEGEEQQLRKDGAIGLNRIVIPFESPRNTPSEQSYFSGG